MKACDLAKLLGVSPATISLVLNDKPGLSQKLRQRLTEQIIELGYEDMLAGSKKKASQQKALSKKDLARPSIAFISYMNNNPWEEIYSFYGGVLEGAQQEAKDIDCNLVVIYRESETNLKQALRRAGEVIGAVIACDWVNEEVMEELTELEIPLVFIDSFDPTIKVNAVNVDNRQSMYSIVEYLKQRGHRDIGYAMRGDERNANDDRRIAFRRALKDLHLRDRQERYYITGMDHGPMDTSLLEARFKEAETLPTAIVTENDIVGLLVINALKKVGLRVPEDVSVIGFDNNPLSRITDPPMTTVVSSRHRIGRECVALAIRLRNLYKMDMPHLPMKISISTEIIERQSVADITK